MAAAEAGRDSYGSAAGAVGQWKVGTGSSGSQGVALPTAIPGFVSSAGSGAAEASSSSGLQGAGASGLYEAPRKKYTSTLKSHLDTEAEASRDHFQKQRATMTAAHVFTWGGRFKYARGNSSSHSTPWTPGKHKAPLRLDAYTDD